MTQFRFLGSNNFTNIWLIDRVLALHRVVATSVATSEFSIYIPFDYGLILFLTNAYGVLQIGGPPQNPYGPNTLQNQDFSGTTTF